MKDDNRKQEKNEIRRNRAQTAQRVRRIVLIFLLIFIVFVLVMILSGVIFVRAAVSPMDEEEDTPVEVEIPMGSSASSIGEILEGEDLITNGTFFRYYARYQNITGFQAGTYELSRSMDMNEILETLQDGIYIEEPEIQFVIPEGYWLEQMTEVIAEHSSYDEEEILGLLEDREYAEALVEEYDFLASSILEDEIRYPLEGYLFPAAYEFEEIDTPLEEIITAMLDRMVETYEAAAADEVDREDLEIHEVLTLASIVEREAQTPEDRRLIAGVLENRLEEEMPLQVDPTVAYALGEHLYMTTFDDLEIDNPYNTYRYSGLPPGPIASPGEDAVRAVFSPEESEYLYFYARRNGEVIYNETYEEHNEVHERYREEWIEAEEDEASE